MEKQVQRWAFEQGAPERTPARCEPTADERLFRCETAIDGAPRYLDAVTSEDGQRVQILER